MFKDIQQAIVCVGLVEVLADGLADKNERVRRRVMACLGELLFYIATQQESSTRSAWSVSSSTIGAVARTLEPGQDEITQVNPIWMQGSIQSMYTSVCILCRIESHGCKERHMNHVCLREFCDVKPVPRAGGCTNTACGLGYATARSHHLCTCPWS